MDRTTVSRLAKLLRLLTSNHDGEVLAAVGRINGIVAANDIDWDAALGGAQVDLTREQLQTVYDAGYQKAMADVVAAAPPSRPREDDWAPAGNARADELGENLEDLRVILDAAAKAKADGLLSSFEDSFVDSMAARVSSWGRRAFVSEKQWGVLKRLKVKLVSRGYV